jgi:hypothetical protein
MTGIENETINKLPFTAVAAPDPQSYHDSEDAEASKSTDYTIPQTTGPPATRKELWSYYAYYAGNNGIGSFQ